MMKEQLNKYQAFKALYDQEGGQLLVKDLLKEIVDCMELQCAQYRNMTHEQFVTNAANMATKLDIVRKLTRSKQDLERVSADIESALQ
jgi:hypothetical protein